jgi:hypothetical protein
MATITKVRRVANPRKRRRRFSTLRNKKGRFVKASRARNKRATPKRKHNTARRVVRKRRSNPVLIELASLAGNPRKRRKTLAKRKYRKTRARASNPRRRRTRRVNAAPRRRRRTAVARPVRRRRRRSNPVAVAPVRRRRRYSRRRRVNSGVRRYSRRRRMNSSRRRNPMFGRTGAKDMLIMVGGGLVGVAATKFLPTLIPSSVTSSLGSSPLASIAITGAGAFVAGWLAKRFVGSDFGDAVLFGGLMQTGSAILTAFAPAVLSQQLALSGVGDIVPGWFAVPQNPVTNRAPQPMMMPSSKGGVSGFGPGGFGYRRSR